MLVETAIPRAPKTTVTFRSRLSTTFVRRTVFSLSVVAITAFALQARSSTILLRTSLNPDEGDLLASGRRAALSLIPFKDFTSTTYGPMWPFTLGWLHRLGMPLTVPMGRLLATLVVVGCCVAIALATQRRFGTLLTLVVVAPFTIHWITGFYNLDFLILSSEILPLAFLALGCVVAFPPAPISLRRATCAAALFGCVLLAKYSFIIVIAVALVALIVKVLASGHGVRRAFAVGVLAPVSPLAVLSGWALAFGVASAKIFETFSITWAYMAGGGVSGKSPSLHTRINDAWRAVLLVPSARPLVALILFAVVVGLVRHRRGASRTALAFTLLAACAVAASFVSLMALVPPYPHYVNVSFGGLMLAMFLIALTPRRPVESRPAVLGSLSLSLGLIAATSFASIQHNFHNPLVPRNPIPTAYTSWSGLFTSAGGRVERAGSVNGVALSQVCPPKSKVFVWGWGADLYSYYDWVPASRYVITTMAIIGRPFIADPPVYRPRILADLRAEKPVCVVDASPDWFMLLFPPLRDLRIQWPELQTELSRDYVATEFLLDNTIPFTIWVRNT